MFIHYFFIGVIVLLYLWTGCIIRNYEVEEKSKGISKLLNRIISISPLIGVIIFSLLFSLVLNTRLLERIAHSMLVFGLWMMATKYYVNILSHFKKMKLVIISGVGMILTIAFAILYTPLDRYVSLVYTVNQKLSVLISCIVLLIYYLPAFFSKKDNAEVKESVLSN